MNPADSFATARPPIYKLVQNYPKKDAPSYYPFKCYTITHYGRGRSVRLRQNRPLDPGPTTPSGMNSLLLTQCAGFFYVLAGSARAA